MDDQKTQELLLKLVEDVAIIKTKLDMIEEIKVDTKGLNSRIEKIEAQNERHDDSIKKLENRCNIMEQFTRNNMNDAKKQQSSAFISMGLAIFSAVLSFVFAMFK